MSLNLRRLLRTDPATDPPQRFGFWSCAAHVLTIWALAVSNIALGVTILWVARHRRRLPWDWPRAATLLVPLGLFTVLYLASIVVSMDPATSAGEVWGIFSFATLPLTILLVRGERDVRRLTDLLIKMTALLAAWAIGQYLITDFGPLDNRIRGPFSHYMTLSGVLLLGDFLLLARMVTGDGWRRPWRWLALALINAALLLTLTRGAWVVAGVTFTVVLLVRARRWVPAYLAAVMVVGLLFTSFAPASWKQRLDSITDPQDASNYDRLCMLQAGLYMVSERPLLGIGPEMVKRRYPIYRHPTAPRFEVSHLHNTFLHLAAERGLLSLAVYFWLMAAGLLLAYRGYRRDGGAHGARADLYLGVILAIVGFNLAGLFEANWRDTEVQRLILFVLAIPICLAADEPRAPTPADGGEPSLARVSGQ